MVLSSDDEEVRTCFVVIILLFHLFMNGYFTLVVTITLLLVMEHKWLIFNECGNADNE